MNMELVATPRQIAVEEQKAEHRRVALERLNAEAETADAIRARQIMLQGRAISRALEEAKEPFDQARLAGKAAVLAARRLGNLLLQLPNANGPGRPGHQGPGPSQRTLLTKELGLSRTVAGSLCRLARVADPEFQRYIQREDIIPSFNGALWACAIVTKPKSRGNLSTQRRRKLGIKTPSNPSLDEAHSLIIKALGHLGTLGHGGSQKGQTARGLAMDHLYAAEDALRPFTSGYGEK